MSPNPITGRIDHVAQAIAERVVNLVMDAIDLNAVLERIDVDAIVERVDVEKLIERVDVNAIVERVDIGRIVDQLDIDALVAQTELGSIIAKSTTGVASEVLDVIRAQGVGLDDFFARWTNRLLPRSPGDLPVGPPLLVGAQPGGAQPGGAETGGAEEGEQ